jgi:hypothetical protein
VHEAVVVMVAGEEGETDEASAVKKSETGGGAWRLRRRHHQALAGTVGGFPKAQHLIRCHLDLY